METNSLIVDILKSMNFSHEVMSNVWITAGIGKTSDAASIFDYLSRFIKHGDTIIVSQIATPVTMGTIHGNTCYNGIEEIMLS
ncbi:MAG: hypothetical protein HGA95_00580 [Caldiserica bacterium]|nr:hypothetical protein [Caldisericota bacterium]